MRQAGRYMSEYRALRERYSLLDICRTPDLATEVTLQPVRRIDVDAAILFSDLLLPLEPMGIPFDFVRAKVRRSNSRCASEADLARVRRFEPREALAHVLDAIRQIKHELAGRVPLIGFAGAPFTLASYAIEGGHSNIVRAHEGADVRHRRRRGTASAICSRTSSATISSRRSKPASTPCRCSTRGSAR